MSRHIVIDSRIRRSSTGRYTDRLVEHLQSIDKENKYTIVLSKGDTWKPTSKNFHTITAPFKQFSFNPIDQLLFSRLLYKLDADLVHFLNQQPLFYFRPVVTTTMDFTMLHYTRAGRTPLPIHHVKMLGYRFLFWYSNKKSKHIITISDYVKSQLNSYYSFTKGKTTTTYLASEPPHPLTVSPRQHKPKQFLLYVGTAFPHKNLSRLIQAFELIAEQNPTLHLVFVGKKEYHYDQLEKIAKQNPYSKRIIFTGFVDDDVLVWYFKHALAYVFPSLSEGFGLPGLEAATYGCPVISSNATCLPEIYGDAAAYFDPQDVHDMASTIMTVLDSKSKRDELIKNGYDQLKKYSWDKTAKETLQVYESVFKPNT